MATPVEKQNLVLILSVISIEVYLACLKLENCFTFHDTTTMLKNKKKQEKNTEKKTNRSICS